MGHAPERYGVISKIKQGRKHMYTIKQFAEHLCVSEVVVRTWIARHGLSVRRIGRRIYITDGDYLQWIESKKTSKSEMDENHSYICSKPPAYAKKMRKIY